MNSTLSNKVEKGFEITTMFLSLIASLGMVSIVAIIIISVITRKFFSYPLYFSEEIVGILMSVSLFLALPLVTLKGGHIRITIVTEYIKKRSKKVYNIVTRLSYLVGIAFCAWLIIEAVPWLQFAIKHNLKTETARILLYPAMISLPISILMMAAIFVARLFGWLKKNEN